MASSALAGIVASAGCYCSLGVGFMQSCHESEERRLIRPRCLFLGGEMERAPRHRPTCPPGRARVARVGRARLGRACRPWIRCQPEAGTRGRVPSMGADR